MLAVLAGCGSARRDELAGRPSATASTASAASAPAPAVSPAAGPATSGPAASTPAAISGGWEITVYYTAVEAYHDGEPERVTGCSRLDCAHGRDDLGSYPADFVAAVKSEGTGRTATGRYLNWSYDVGYWLDTAPRDTDGDPLEPYVSAAADPEVLRHGTRFRIAGCGHQDDGSAPPAAVCATLRAAAWRIDDEFTPGLGGRKHVDAYIGPETGPDFTDSDRYLTLTGATLRLG
jgi:hypothetical protein